MIIVHIWAGLETIQREIQLFAEEGLDSWLA